MVFANAGYLSVAISSNLFEAVLACKITYLGGCFVPTVLLLAIINICNYEIKSLVKVVLFAYDFFVYLMVLTIGNSDVYYTNIYLGNFADSTVLVHDYGIGHNFFYVIVYGYVALGVILLGYSVIRKKSVSRKSLYTLILVEVLNFVLFIGARIINPDFEVMPAVYVVDGWLLLYMHHRAITYNIDDCISSTIEKQEKYGYIMFDNDGNYLGSNPAAQIFFPEIKIVRLILKSKIFLKLI